ncbi:TRAP transporter substrate-binding protein [Coralloluteibacterium thermophilus]|uniref:TRAP transporter substrate-binding protein n=1 Tax=Coralloluteibacterium thermophilum TaxID=2707049 RepID=A0ABV9NE17_9GAMM
MSPARGATRRGVRGATAGTALAAGLAACGAPQPPEPARREPTRRWRMATTWPAGFPGLGEGARWLGEAITEASGGQLQVEVAPAGVAVPTFDVFDAVARGTVEMGHAASWYWMEKAAAMPLFTAVPFGLDAEETLAWLHQGEGLALWRELYAHFGLMVLPAGNTGMHMAGWSRRQIRSLADLQGLRIRMPGLGGQVMARAGAQVVPTAGAQLVEALERGRLDAAEWMGPYNDLEFGLEGAAGFYYFPGWQKPQMTAECLVNLDAWNALPEHLQRLVALCCRALDAGMLAHYAVRNQEALDRIVRAARAELRRLPEDVLVALQRAAEQELGDLAAADPFARRVIESQRAFRARGADWRTVSAEAYAAARG